MSGCNLDQATFIAKEGETVIHVHSANRLVCMEMTFGGRQWLATDWLTALRIASLIFKYSIVTAWRNHGARR